jgi:DNA-binding response OmpR family regulator
MGVAWVCPCDEPVAATVVDRLAELGYTVRRAAAVDPEAVAAELLAAAEPEIAVVAAGAEGGSLATEVVVALRARPALEGLPLLLVIDSAGLERTRVPASVDDVLVLPAGAAELRLRIARAWQRAGATVDGDAIVLAGLRLDLATYETTIDGRPVDLTPMEHRLLRFLVIHPRRVFTREALLDRVWGYDHYGATRTVDVQVRRLRAKLGDDYGAAIQTVRGVGYRLER